MFTSQEKDMINKTINMFPIATEISIAKIKGSSASYYGAIKEQDSIKEIDNKYSIFEIGSITKLFTSAILSRFQTEQLIDLNETINVKLGFPLKDNHKISYKELATHTSGLPSTLNLLFPAIFGKIVSCPYEDFTEEKLIHYLKNDLKLVRRGKISYSNIGVGLLGYILSKYTNQSYEQLLKQKLLDPLNMKDTTTIRKEIKGKLVAGLDKKGRASTNWDFNILAGAGGGLSSVIDLSKFIIANIEGKYEYLNNQKHCIYERGKRSMGIGWIILRNKLPNIDEAHFHPGGSGGYRSSMVANFKNDSGIVILSNVSGLYLFKGNKIDRLAFKLLNT